MATSRPARGQWTSRTGFVLAAAGSAIGLGNIWRFPYVAGQSGGGAFVVLYLLCILLISVPYLYAELAIGRHSQRNPVGAIRAIPGNSSWALVGGLCVLTGVFILSYYAVIAGWAFGYIFKTVFAPATTFGTYVASPAIVVPLFGLFLLFTVLVVYGGIEKGIERWAKLLMPILLLLIVIIIMRSVTLPGAGAGIEFYLRPDFSKVTGRVVLAALGQAFFSLSLGMGAMITYGSYISRKEDLVTAGAYVAAFDTGIALMAGFMIFPALFAMGVSPDAGPALVFIILPQVFQALPLGTVIGAAFFVLLSIAALTSTVSLMEVVVSYFVDEKRWTRRRSVALVGLVAFALGVPSALSAGAVPAFTDMTWLLGEGGFLGQTDFLSVMDMIWGNLSLAIGALLLSIFVGWIWGAGPAGVEIGRNSRIGPGQLRVWGFFLRYVCPIVIFIVLLNLFGLFGPA
jgi:neurotransmitter:Na+ symporter, NSS family